MVQETYSDDKTRKWVEYGRSISQPIIPKQDIPFISPRLPGRNFSDGDLAIHVLDKGYPLALNGQTGIGKTTLVRFYCHLAQLHFAKAVATRYTGKDKVLYGEGTENGEIVSRPGPLSEALIHKGLFFLDEAAALDPDYFTSYNAIIQALEDQFMTQFGVVNLDWSWIRFVAAGNFHDKGPDVDAASRYRFYWMDIQPQEGGASKLIDRLNYCSKAGLDLPPVPEEYSVRRMEDFPTNPQFVEALVGSTNDLFHRLSRYATFHRLSGRSGRRSKSRKEELTALKKEFRSIDDGVYWSRAPAIAQSANQRANILWHPDMTSLDVQAMLLNIFRDPAVAVEEWPLPDGPQALSEGMEKIIKEHAQAHHERLQRTLH